MREKHPLTMRTKLIFMFLGLIVLPLGFFGTMLFSIQQNVTESYVVESLEKSTTQLAERLNQELQAVCGLGNLYYLDGELAEGLSAGDGLHLRLEPVRELLSKYSAYPGRIYADASVLTPEGELYGGRSYTGILDPAAARALPAESGNTVWRSHLDFPEGAVSGDYVYAVRALHDHSTWESTGTLLLSVRETELRKIYSGYLTESQNAYLLDPLKAFWNLIINSISSASDTPTIISLAEKVSLTTSSCTSLISLLASPVIATWSIRLA